MPRILLIDDDEDTIQFLRHDLEKAGHHVESLDGARGGLEAMTRGDFDLLLLDNQMPRVSGIEFLGELRQRGVSVPVILMTGHATPDAAIQARKLGARAYFVKPRDGRLFLALEPLIADMLRTSRLMKERILLPSADAPPSDSATTLLGNSPAMQKVYERVGQVAESNASVLILGETGTGKELIARALFQYSSRSDKPFIAVNCAALPEPLLESELFGHECGAFTGADRRHIGKFEQADGGTILLDEIGDMSLTTQAKILRVLQEGEVLRLKGTAAVKVDVRVIACTHRDLEAALRRKEFRDDLYYRLNNVTLRLPSLRERPEDLGLLARHFLGREARALGRPGLTFHAAALEKLGRYPWPGNVRELKSIVKLAALICDGVQVQPENLEIGPVSSPEAPRLDPGEADALAGLRVAVRWAWHSDKQALWPLLHDLLQRELLRFAAAQGLNKSQRADRLGIGRTKLWSLLKELGLDSPEEGGP